MNLTQTMRKDFNKIMGSKSGIAESIQIIDPNGESHDIQAVVSVIHNLIDPDTGQPVSGFLATASISRLHLMARNLSIPAGEFDQNKRPWVLVYNDIDGNSTKYIVVRSAPDEAQGNVLLDLGSYE